jgi:hypothetical protein
MSRDDFAWAAGFFDADGCFANSATPVATIAQVGLECLDIFRNVVGVGTIRGPYEKATAKIDRKPQWVFYAYGGNARTIFRLLRPWLGSYRRTQGARSLDLDLDLPVSDRWFQTLPLSQRAAWAGGFFDGEGCFSRSDAAGLTARITHTDLELLERFLDVVEVGKIYGPYEPHPTSHGKKPIYVYAASGFERFQALFAFLWTNLGSAKRLRAMDLLHDHLTYWKCGHRRGPTWKMHCPKCFKPGPKPG